MNTIAHDAHPQRIVEFGASGGYRQSKDLPDSDASAVLACTAEIAAPLSAADRLAQQWQKRRNHALEAVSLAMRENRLHGASAAELAQVVHNIAGTAGMFGESELGIRAGALERALKVGASPQESSGLAESFLRAA